MKSQDYSTVMRATFAVPTERGLVAARMTANPSIVAKGRPPVLSLKLANAAIPPCSQSAEIQCAAKMVAGHAPSWTKPAYNTASVEFKTKKCWQTSKLE